MPDSKDPQKVSEDTASLQSVIASQNELLKKLQNTFGAEEEEERQRRIVKLFLRGASLIALAISGLIATWELGAYLKESWETDQLARDMPKLE